MRVALYLRVSTDKQETENQAIQLREFAARQGWQIVREYADYETGYSPLRQIYGKARADRMYGDHPTLEVVKARLFCRATSTRAAVRESKVAAMLFAFPWEAKRQARRRRLALAWSSRIRW